MNDFIFKSERSDEMAATVEEPSFEGGQLIGSGGVKAVPDLEILVDNVKSEISGCEEVTIKVEFPTNTDDVDPLAAPPPQCPLAFVEAALLYSRLQTPTEQTPSLLDHTFSNGGVVGCEEGPQGKNAQKSQFQSLGSNCRTSTSEGCKDHFMNPTSFMLDSTDGISDVESSAARESIIEEDGRISSALGRDGVKDDYISASSPEIVENEPEIIEIDDDSDELSSEKVESDDDDRDDDSDSEDGPNENRESSLTAGSRSETEAASEGDDLQEVDDSGAPTRESGPRQVSSVTDRPSGSKRKNSSVNESTELTALPKKRRSERAQLLEIYERILGQLQELEGVPTDSSSDEDSGVEEKDSLETDPPAGGSLAMDDDLGSAALANQVAEFKTVPSNPQDLPLKTAEAPESLLKSMKSKLEKLLNPKVVRK